jgi:inosine-uridine nucleoside N-ribohydrolase
MPLRVASLVLTTAALLLAPALASLAHAASKVPVIVDTDMALDDARALALLARASSLELVAVLTSDGGSSPCEGASRVHRLLDRLGRGGTPVGVGEPLAAPPPAWRSVSTLLDDPGSGDAPACDSLPGASKLARQAIDRSISAVTWVALGPMTNLASLLERPPRLEGRIRAIYYSGDLAKAEPPDWNTAHDRRAAGAVLGAGVPIYLVPPREAEAALPLDASLLGAIAGVDSPAARWISRLHADPRMPRIVADGDTGPWDDAVALALLEPTAFESTIVRASPHLSRLVPKSPGAMRKALLRALAADAGSEARP